MSSGHGPAGDVLRQWQAVRANGDIQFAPLGAPPPPQPPPGWLVAFVHWLERLFDPVARGLAAVAGWLGPVGKWLLIAAGATAAAALVWTLARAALRRARSSAQPAEPAINAQAALLLLAEADRLATAGNWDGAVHLLLRRSVEQIGEALPGALTQASTAREIAALTGLSAHARAAFAAIAALVERSRYAVRALSEADWHRARAAYADFAAA